jgi:fluoride ion exporter CrcB/FEX
VILAGLAFVALAAVGTLLRAEVGWAANHPGRWPWGTLAINVVAAWGLGLVVGAAGTDSAAWSGVTVAIAAGGLGALGTVSGLAAEVVGLASRSWRGRRPPPSGWPWRADRQAGRPAGGGRRVQPIDVAPRR